MKKLQLIVVSVLMALLMTAAAISSINLISMERNGASLEIDLGSPNSLQGKSNIIRRLNVIKASPLVARIELQIEGKTLYLFEREEGVYAFLSSHRIYKFPGSANAFVNLIISPSRRIIISIFIVFLLVFTIFAVVTIRRKVEFEESQKLIIRFAHDIRNPLKALRTQLSQKDTKGLIEDIENMSNELLQSKRNQHSEVFYPLHEIAEILSSDLPNCEITMHGNRNEFRRFLRNISTNAHEAKGEKPNFLVSCQSQDDSLTITLKDDGPGFPQHILSKIGKVSITTKDKGNGIGIYESLRALKIDEIEANFYNDNGAVIELKLNRFQLIAKIRASLVLIDDDRYLQASWRDQAQSISIEFKCFNDFASFVAQASEIDRASAIFSDSHLRDGKGEELLKHAFDMGFKNLYITTSLFTEDPSKYPWLKGIVGKDFPKTLLI